MNTLNTTPDAVGAIGEANRLLNAAMGAFNPVEPKPKVEQQRYATAADRRIIRVELAIQDNYELSAADKLLAGLFEPALQKVMILVEKNPQIKEAAVQVLTFHSSTINSILHHDSVFLLTIPNPTNTSRVCVYSRPKPSSITARYDNASPTDFVVDAPAIN